MLPVTVLVSNSRLLHSQVVSLTANVILTSFAKLFNALIQP
jgi:hypothetical protein